MPRVLLLCLVLTLAACDDGGGIVGTWEPAGGPGGSPASRTTFFANGSARIVARAADGPEAYDARYTVSGDTLLTLADGQGSERFRLRVSRDTLVLESPATGSRTVLTRVRG